MPINPTGSATSVLPPSVQANAVPAAVLVPMPGGNLQSFTIGTLVNAVVIQSNPRETRLNINGNAVAVRGLANLAVGAELDLRVAGEPGQPVFELVREQPPAQRDASSLVPFPAPTTRPGQPALVEVLARQGNNQFQVAIDGQEPGTASSALPLQVGGRYTLQVVQTPRGTVLLPPESRPERPTAVAAALIRGLPARPPDLGGRVKPLLQELASLPSTLPRPVSEAAAAVQQSLRAFVPQEPRPLTSAEVHRALRDGGLQYEAKLAIAAEPLGTPPRLAPGNSTSPAQAVPRETSPLTSEHRAAAPTLSTAAPQPLHWDLKAALLNLVESARLVRDASVPLPVSRAALDGIEAAQAVNALNQQSSGVYFLQIPMPDGDDWRSVHLALEPNWSFQEEGETGPANGFRALLHMNLTELGETVVDVGFSSGGLLTVVYAEDMARQRLATQAEAFKSALAEEGFASAWVELRPLSELPERLRRRAAAMQAGSPLATGLVDVQV